MTITLIYNGMSYARLFDGVYQGNQDRKYYVPTFGPDWKLLGPFETASEASIAYIMIRHFGLPAGTVTIH